MAQRPSAKYTIRAEDKTRSALRRARGELQEFEGAVRALSVAATAMGGATALAVRQSAGEIDDLAKAGDQLDATTESIQAVRHATELYAGSSTDADKAIGSFTKRLGEAIDGSGEAKNALDKLGLSAQDIAKLPLDEQLAVISREFQGLETAAERNAVAADLFSRENMGMLNVLAAGEDGIRGAREEVDRYGSAVSAIEADRVESMNDEWTRLNEAAKGTRHQLTVALAPAIEEVTGLLKESVTWWGELVQDMQVATPEENAREFAESVTEAAEAERLLSAAMEQREQSADKASRTQRMLQLQMEELRDLAGSESAAQSALEGQYVGMLPGTPEDIQSTVDRIKDLESQLDGARGSTEDAGEKIGALKDRLQELRDGSQEAGDETKEVGDRAEEAAEKNDALSVAMDTIEKQFDGLTQSEGEAIAGMREVGEETEQTAQRLGVMGRAMDLVEGQFDDLDEQEARAVAGLQEISEEGEKTFRDDLESAVDGWGNRFSEKINDAVWDAEAGFDNILESFGKMLTQMIIQKEIVEPMLSAGMDFLPGGSNAQGSAWVGGVQRYANGGVVDSPTLFPMARGAGLMGEAGPEAIMPLERTQSGDLGVKADVGGGGAAGVEVNVYNEGGGQVETRERQGDGGKRIVDVLIGAVADDIRSGGKVSKAITGSTTAKPRTAGR
ncbi:MAG: phage tail tape measure protein [Thiohalospira sp.]